MDDNDKKFRPKKGPARGGPKAAGPRSRDGAAGKSGKPSFGAKKPYAPRGERPMAAEGERKPYEKREGPRKPYAPRGDRARPLCNEIGRAHV